MILRSFSIPMAAGGPTRGRSPGKFREVGFTRTTSSGLVAGARQ